jgi:hypothetical protein
MASRINDFYVGTASKPERLRFKGDPEHGKSWMAEKLQIDPKQIKRELSPDLPKSGSSVVFRIRRNTRRHK